MGQSLLHIWNNMRWKKNETLSEDGDIQRKMC